MKEKYLRIVLANAEITCPVDKMSTVLNEFMNFFDRHIKTKGVEIDFLLDEIGVVEE